VLPVDKVKHILLMPTGHDIDMYPMQSCLKNRPSETFSPATLRFMDFFPLPLSKTSAAGNKGIGWGKGVMPRQPVSWAEWTKGVLKSGSQKPVPRHYEWTKQAEERRKQAEAEKLKEQEEKNKLIADTKSAIEAAKREQRAQEAQKKKADEATRQLKEARERCEALSLLAAEAEEARKNAELLAKLAGATDHENEEGGCVVCMEAAADYAFLPCGHRCVCRTHAEMIHTSTRTCPICRQPTQSFNKIFAA
jgi:hypothetical protein